MFALLVYLYRKKLPHGTVLAVYLLAYPVIRFLMEFLRGDNRTPFASGLNVAQGISIGLLVIGVLVLTAFRRPRENPAADSGA